MGACFFDVSCASGTVFAAAPSFGVHCQPPPGLFVSSHSCSKRLPKNPLSHLVGVDVHAPSRPEVIVASALPVLNVLRQPRFCSSMPAPAGANPTYCAGSAAPCAF